MKNKPKVLFICKERNDSYGPSFGLINSCKFICNALHKHHIESEVITVIDNNCIDREVTKYKPTHVFIEALWVVPSKFEVLCKLHPKVSWYVRVHSKIPFIANEGMAIEWLRGYHEVSKKFKNLHISANNVDIIDNFKHAYGISVSYHPNIYSPPDYGLHGNPNPIPIENQKIIDIGCFGAIRPLKNQLIQAMAAISFGNEIGKKVRFHINANRVELKGDAVLKNLEHSFANTPHELVKHPWKNHKDFIILARTMDLGMQVSLSETFNIVAADFVWNNVPVVGSDEIDWLSFLYKANPTDLHSILSKLRTAYYGKSLGLQKLNKWNLEKYNEEATKVWLNGL
jgi:hypothetical protein